ncbi:MAG: 3'-5' exonuclease, partial [Sphingobacteriales bacterium]
IMYLFFDTETTGTPRNYKAPVTDLNNWPRLVQIAWILQDKDGNTLVKESSIIKPSGFIIPSDAAKIHGITTDIAQKNGVDLLPVLNSFNNLIDSSEYLIAHNVSFDKNIVGAEFLRVKMKNPVPDKKLICTMMGSVNYCAINGPYGFKYPKLTELHQKLFNSRFDGAHDALADITATAKCFWEMRKRGLI